MVFGHANMQSSNLILKVMSFTVSHLWRREYNPFLCKQATKRR